MKLDKPLGGKAYGSIPHLPTSRLGPADHYIHQGQADILTVKPRDKDDLIIVTEKLDGSCVAVANVDGEIVALGRSGYLAKSSPYKHVACFHDFVEGNKSRFEHLNSGERLCGEWIAMAHGTLYDTNSCNFQPFTPFDWMVGKERATVSDMILKSLECDLMAATVIYHGGAFSVDDAKRVIVGGGNHGAVDGVEGCVWRCERNGKFDFAAKFVSHNKVDGKYFPEISGKDPIVYWP